AVLVDLVLLVDSSDSMTESIGTQSKWQAVTAALRDFVHDPRSAGLGVGLQFFPQPGSGSPCDKDQDCGYSASPSTPVCQPAGFGEGMSTSGDTVTRCGARLPACPGGAACLPGGSCSKSALDCTNVGKPCAGGDADDLCVALGSRCDFTDNESCPTDL